MMNSNINTDNVSASVEVPTLDATLSANTLIGESNANALTSNTSANTLIGSIGNGVIVSGIRSIYVNSIEQQVIGDTAYISLSYNILTDKPTIPTKTSDLINDSGFINSGYVTTNEFTSLSNQVGIIQNQIPTINNDIEEINDEIDEINETLINKVNQSDFNTLQTQVTNNTNNIGTNTTNIQTNTSNINTLQNIVDAQSQSITSATELIEDNADAIETLQNDVSSINTVLSNKVDTSTFNVLDAQVQTNTTAIAGKQDTLVSGTNIKTINNQSLLGSGDITITGGQATDVQINGTSITSNNTANIETFSTYNATTNKIATMNDLPVVPTIPTKTSDLVNDSGFITNTVNNLTNYTLTSNLSAVATSGDYNDLSNLPTIPTKTSDLTNDSGFITKTYNDASILFDTSKRINFTPASGTSYANYGGCYYYKENDKVHLHIGISGLTANTNTTIGTLPVGYRPNSFISSMGMAGSLAQTSIMQVANNGNVYVRSQGNYALIDINFDAVQ